MNKMKQLEMDILNPQQQQLPTPKKPAKNKSFTPHHLKFRYTVVEKPKSSRLGIILIISWILLISMLLFSSYHNKLQTLQNISNQQQIQCKFDYQKNKCQKGLKATLTYCEEKKKCYQSQPQLFYQGKISISFIAGEIIRDFVDGAGVYVCAGGLIMMWMLIRKQSVKEIRREYQEYFQ